MNRIWIAVGLLAAAAPLAPSAVAQQQAAGRAEVELPKTLREAAVIDITGYWVAQGSEDWRYRWMVAEVGDSPGVPVSAKGRQVSDLWDPEADEVAGLACKAYGAPGLMRLPTRLHITWQDDNTLRIDTDAGTQTRLLTYGKPAPPPGERSWQGYSVAVWQTSGPIGAAPQGQAQGARRLSRTAGQLKVVTTHLREGYLRKNGIPYSENAILTEYFTRALSPNGDEWLVVTAIVDDPTYLNEPFITSSHFKLEPDGSRWSPTECNTREPR
jgi:hypothetical protein